MKIVGLMLLGVMGLLGQYTSTIYQTLGSNRNGNFTTANVKNIGQGYHKVIVLFRDNVPNVCASNEGNIELFGSPDNAVFSSIPQSVVGVTVPTGSATYKFSKSIEGYGAYPYVRIAVSNTDAVNCNYDVTYSANINSPDRHIPKLDGTALTVPGRMQFVEVDASVIGATTLVTNTTGSRIAIQGISIYNETAAQTFVLNVGALGIAYKLNMPAGFSMLYPPTNTPYLIGLAGQPVTVTLTANTHVVVGVWYTVQ